MNWYKKYPTESIKQTSLYRKILLCLNVSITRLAGRNNARYYLIQKIKSIRNVILQLYLVTRLIGDAEYPRGGVSGVITYKQTY